jgi:anaerobic magnesium-protoporphyrin IX monomethyl ester cyclase
VKALICSVYAAAGDDPFLSLLPVGVGSLVAVLRKRGVEARAANLNGMSPAALSKLLLAERPDLLGISVMTHNRHDSVGLAELAKMLNPACFVVFGGPHATHRCREILASYPCVDAVVLGEGEETLAELAGMVQRGETSELQEVRGIAFRHAGSITITPPRPPLADLDLLPATYEGFRGGINIDLRRQTEFLITSRGCPAACTFCSSPLFWGRSLRFRTPLSMVDEIRAIRDRYGLIYFSIRDDTFTADRTRVIKFCRLLLEERLFILWNCQSRVSAVDEEMLLWMRRAGCDCIQYGVESGSPALLEILGKRIIPQQIIAAAQMTRRVGIRLSIYLMTGLPGEGEGELKETLSLLQRVTADDGQVSPLAYYPGTRLFGQAVERGELSADLFERSREEALYARNDPFVAAATSRLLRKIETVAQAKLSARAAVMAAARQLTGFCHAGTIAVGELLAEEGDFSGAQAQYQEITCREPDNPWGWLLLGELCRETGRRGEATEAFRRLAALIPAHLPAWEALVFLHRRGGDPAEAQRCREQVRRLTAMNREEKEDVI